MWSGYHYGTSTSVGVDEARNAFDQCGLINSNTHQRWVQQLLNLSSKNTPDGNSKIRTDQLVRADRELFTLMAETLQISGEKLTDTPPPMDVCMWKLLLKKGL